MSVALVGRRVVLRRRAGERAGRPVYADVLGVLIEAAGGWHVVRRDDGSVVSVADADVHRLRPVPPGRAQVFALEETAALGWPAPETARLGGWLLRAGDGWTRRANSALLLGDPGMPVADALEKVRDWYGERGLTPRLAIPLPSMARADQVAARHGWASDVDVEVLTAAVVPAPIDSGVRLAATPGNAWSAAYQARTMPPVAARILTAPAKVTFGSIVDGDTTVAIGRGVVVGEWLGVAAMEVPADHRRRGLAGRMLRGLLAWGASLGATRCYLQVESTNAPALALYRGLGFTRHHRYRCRIGGAAGWG